jgi:hypothetical protein
MRRDLIAHLGTLDFITAQQNVIFLGPQEPGTHLATGLRSGPASPGTASGSPPRPNGSTGSPPPTRQAGSKTNSSASADTPVLWSTKLATSRLSPKQRTQRVSFTRSQGVNFQPLLTA